MRFHTPPGGSRAQVVTPRNPATMLCNNPRLPGVRSLSQPREWLLRTGSALQLGGRLCGVVVAPPRWCEQIPELGEQSGSAGDVAADRGELVEPDPERVPGLDVLGESIHHSLLLRS